MSKNEKLQYWQSWLSRNRSAFDAEYLRMDEREELYRGEKRTIEPLTGLDSKGERRRRVTHLRNIIAENIESQINSAIPQPKVTARRREDERLARLIENMLRNELDRLPMEQINDQMERTIPIQGGAYFYVDWDDSSRTHGNVGNVVVEFLHPKEVVPQDGIFTSVEDMDAVVLKLPQTKSYIKRKYGVDVEDEGEAEPDIRGTGDDISTADDLVTMYTAYYRDDGGKIGKYSWCGDKTLEDLADYQARKIRRCRDCGKLLTSGEKECPGCGGTDIQSEKLEEETVWKPIQRTWAEPIPGPTEGVDENGFRIMQPQAKLPYYQPDCYPVFLQRNISLYGRLLGDSDVDKIKDQQNTVNRMEQKIIDRLVKAGTRITLPDRADFRVDPEDQEKWYIGNAADKSLIGVYDFSGNLQYEMSYLAQVYEEARQMLGITDSFQGRSDTTAKSGVAKQFAAAQSAGRLESKRVLKEAAYAELFRRIFQLKLAYCDEPRPVVSQDDKGDAEYGEFNRYDFLERDEDGNWYWNDDFLFSCDTSAPLASNREQLWQDTTASLQAGAFGDPTDLNTLIFYWSKMELLHYPGAADTKTAMEKRKAEQDEALRQQQEAAMRQQEMQMQAQRQDIRLQARQRAEEDAMGEVDAQAKAAAQDYVRRLQAAQKGK